MFVMQLIPVGLAYFFKQCQRYEKDCVQIAKRSEKISLLL